MQHFDQFYKSWNFFTGCYTFDNFFQTEGNGQDSAEFIDFRKQLLPHSKQNKNQNYQTLSSFYDKLISKTATKRQQYEVEYIQDYFLDFYFEYKCTCFAAM